MKGGTLFARVWERHELQEMGKDRMAWHEMVGSV